MMRAFIRMLWIHPDLSYEIFSFLTVSYRSYFFQNIMINVRRV